MKGKIFAQMALLTAVAGMMSTRGNSRPFYLEYNEPVEKPIPNGCKKYSFYGVEVVAISEKSARKKAAKKAGIKI